MAQNVTLNFINDQDFFLAVDVSGLAAYYDLTVGTFRMQARRVAGQANVDYAWSSDAAEGTAGTIAYNAVPPLLLITAPYADMRNLLAGTYAYGLQYERDVPLVRFVVTDLWVGALNVQQGVVFT